MAVPPAEEPDMTTTVRAVYENGVLRPTEPLALTEGQTVSVTVAPVPPAPPISEEEFIRRVGECQSYHEWFELTKLLPPDDGGYDVVKALDENRRWSGERPLLPEDRAEP